MSATGACARAGGERRRAEPRYAAGSDSEGLPEYSERLRRVYERYRSRSIGEKREYCNIILRLSDSQIVPELREGRGTSIG